MRHSVNRGPALRLNLLGLPPRIPWPAKITIAGLPAVDPERRFGSDPDSGAVYDKLTDDMQTVLSGLADQRTGPVLG